MTFVLRGGFASLVVFSLIFSTTFPLGLRGAEAASTVPKLLNYQARITDSAGVPVSDGNLNIWISVYDAPSAGSCLYAMRGSCGTPSFKTVTVTNGVFSTLIGDTVGGDNEIPDALFDTDALYLGITVASDTEMVPRKRLTTAPYAMNADRLDDLDVTSSGSTTPYIVATTANGNLTITGDPQGSSVSSGSLYVNPAGATANETLFGIASNGSSRFAIDAEGDITTTGSLLATAASSTSQFIFRGAASQSQNIFEVQDSATNRVLSVSATATTVTDLIVSGTCTGCAGASATLQSAYDSSTGTTEIFLSQPRGALTLADSFNSFGGNLFEIQNRINGAGDYSRRYFTVSSTTTAVTSGTQAMPGLSFIGDGDTGLYQNTDNAIAFSAGNSTVMVVEPSGTLRIFGNGGLVVNSGEISAPATIANLVNTVSTTVNFAGAATTLNIGADTGTTLIRNSLTVGSSSSSDIVTFNSRVGSNLTPTTDATFDLGDYNRRWRDLWLSGGSANIALDQSGSSIMRLGFETAAGLRGLMRTPTNIPLQIRNGDSDSGIYLATSGYIGIGTDNPAAPLTVDAYADNGTPYAFPSLGNDIVAAFGKRNDNARISILAADFNTSSIWFGHNANAFEGAINFYMEPGANAMEFEVGGVGGYDLQITNFVATFSGNVDVQGTGGLTVGSGLAVNSNSIPVGGDPRLLVNGDFGTFDIVRVNNLSGNKVFTVSATGTTVTGNLTVNGTCTGCGGGAVTMLETYNNSTSTTEIFTNSTQGALTIADQVTGGGGKNNGIGNLLEVQDRLNTAGDYSQRFLTVSSTNTHINYSNLAATFIGHPCALGCNVFKVTMPTAGLPVAGEGMAEYVYTGNFASNNNSAMVKITGNSLTTGWAQTIQANALTTGIGLRIVSSSTGLTSGSLLSLSSGTTGAISNGLASILASGAYTSVNNVGILNLTANSTLSGTLFSMGSTSLTTGIMMSATATALTTGKMLNFVGGNAMTTGSIIDVATATYIVDNAQGNVFEMDFANASNGSGQNAVVGLNLNSRFNIFNASAGTKTTAVINVNSPTFTQCRVGDSEQCRWIGAFIDGSIDNDLTHTNPDTWDITGIQVGGEGNFTQSSAAGTFTYNGLFVDMPTATQTAGTMDVFGIHVQSGSFSGGVNRYWPFMVDNSGGTNVAGIDTNGNAYVQLNTANTFAVCHATNGTASMQQLTDCSGSVSADYMEMYPAAAGLAVGDIVMPGTLTFNGSSSGEVVQVVKTDSAYAGTMLGVVSNPDHVGDFNSIGHEFEASANPMPVALKGRVKVKVTTENGAIAVGDPITSSSVAGVGMKSSKPGMIVGQALEAWNGPGQGTILVFMGNGFHSGLAITTDGVTSQFNDDFAFLPPAYATETQTAIASRTLSFTGSAWSSASGTSVTRQVGMKLDITDPSNYQFSFRNHEGNLLASLNQAGDLAIAGTLSVEGGFDYAEMFPAVPDIEAGDIVMVDPENVNGYGVTKTKAPYENSAIGVISTKPGFLTGKSEEGSQPVALAGRVPVKVNMENGEILPGDPITSSSTPGIGMKALEAGRVIGIALQGLSSEGTVLIFVNPSWWNGPMPIGSSLAGGSLSISQDSLLDFKNSTLSNVAAIISTSGAWSITSDGHLTAKKVEAETLQTEDVVLVQSEEKSTTSEGVIKDGFSATVVMNPAMKPNSKVFVAFLGDPKGGYWVAEKGEGNFTIHLTMPAVGDLPFEYWIMGVDDRRPAAPPEEDSTQSASETPQVPAELLARPTESASETPVTSSNDSSTSTPESDSESSEVSP